MLQSGRVGSIIKSFFVDEVGLHYSMVTYDCHRQTSVKIIDMYLRIKKKPGLGYIEHHELLII